MTDRSGVSGVTGRYGQDPMAGAKLHGRQLPMFGFGSARYGMLGQCDFSALPLQEGDIFERFSEEMVLVHGYLGEEVNDMVAGEHHAVILIDWKKGEGGKVCCHGLASLGRLGVGTQRRAKTKKELRAERKRNKRLKEKELAKLRAKEREREKSIPDFSGLPFEIATLPNGDRVGDDRARFLFTPVRIKAGFACQVSAGLAHGGAVTEDGQLFMWGCARHGRLGLPQTLGMPCDAEDGHDTYYPSPVPVDFPGAKVRYVACGAKHTLACDDKGAIFAWGLGRYGRLGFGEDEMRELPVEEPDEDGAWDEHSWHQLKPRPILSLQGIRVTRVYAGAYNSFAISGGAGTPPAVYSWGLARYGMLGIGDFPSTCCHQKRFDPDVPAAQCTLCIKRLAPPREGGVPTYIEERRGHPPFARVLAAFPREVAKLHDLPADPQDPLDVYCPTPCEVQQLAARAIVSIEAGVYHHFAVSSSGKLFAWGLLRHGRCGIGKFDPDGHVNAATGRARTDRTVPTYSKERGFELNSRGQIRIVEDDPCSWYIGEPKEVAGFHGARVVRVSAGECHSAAVTEDNKLYTWGVARHGRLGTREARSELLADPHDAEGWYRAEPREVDVATETQPRLVVCTSSGTLFAAREMTEKWKERHRSKHAKGKLHQMGSAFAGELTRRLSDAGSVTRRLSIDSIRSARRVSGESSGGVTPGGSSTARSRGSQHSEGEYSGGGSSTARSNVSSVFTMRTHDKNEGGRVPKVPQEKGVSSGLKAGFKAIGSKLSGSAEKEKQGEPPS